MERLTKRTYTISEPHVEMVTVVPGVNVTNILYRLADYEDTGLTPEEIKDDMPDVRKIEEKLAAYEDAEEAGILIRLPCKPGDTVYRIWKVNGRESVVSKHRFDTIAHIVEWLDKFGKTVFLTREEAEAALAKEG